jgi:hypothetical protein
LTVGHCLGRCGWGHGLCHGVILLCKMASSTPQQAELIWPKLASKNYYIV